MLCYVVVVVVIVMQSLLLATCVVRVKLINQSNKQTNKQTNNDNGEQYNVPPFMVPPTSDYVIPPHAYNFLREGEVRVQACTRD
jgi:hypothetical protein